MYVRRAACTEFSTCRPAFQLRSELFDGQESLEKSSLIIPTTPLWDTLPQPNHHQPVRNALEVQRSGPRLATMGVKEDKND